MMVDSQHQRGISQRAVMRITVRIDQSLHDYRLIKLVTSGVGLLPV